MKKQYFLNAYIIDPKNSIDEIGGLIVNENGKIEAVGKKVNKNNGLIKCKKSKLGYGDYDKIKINNKWSIKKKRKVKNKNKRRKKAAKTSYWFDSWGLNKKKRRKHVSNYIYDNYNMPPWCYSFSYDVTKTTNRGRPS